MFVLISKFLDIMKVFPIFKSIKKQEVKVHKNSFLNFWKSRKQAHEKFEIFWNI